MSSSIECQSEFISVAYLEAVKFAISHSNNVEDRKFAHVACASIVVGKRIPTRILTVRTCNNKEHAEIACLSDTFDELTSDLSQLGIGKSFTRGRGRGNNIYSKNRDMEIENVSTNNNYVVDLVVVRVRKDGSIAMAKPCKECLPVIKEKNVRCVHYTDTNGKLITEPVASMISGHLCSSHKARKAKFADADIIDQHRST